MRRAVLVSVAFLPIAMFLAALMVARAAAPAQPPTPTPASACIPGLQKWAEPSSLLLGDRASVTLVVTGTCPGQNDPIDMVILADMSNSMTKRELGPGAGSPTPPPDRTPGPTPTGEPPPEPTEPGAIETGEPGTGGEPPFCSPDRREATPTRTPRWPPWRTPTPAPQPTPDINQLEPAGKTDLIREEQRWLNDFLGSTAVESDMQRDRLRIGFVGFNDRPAISVPLSSDRGDIASGMNRMRGGETTRINNALREALRLLGGSGKRPDPGRVKVIMILSDFQFCAKDLRVSGLDEGTHVIAVGFGVRNYDRRKLNDLATDAGHVSDRHQLQPVLDVYQQKLGIRRPVSVSSLSVTDELSDTMALVSGSVSPVTVTITGNLLEWRFTDPALPLTLQYGVAPMAEGEQPISRRADIQWLDSLGLPGRADFPPVTLDVFVNTPTATATATATATQTPVPTATPTETPRPSARFMPLLVRSWPPAPPTLTPTPVPTKCIPGIQTVDVALVVDTSTSMNDSTRAGGIPKLGAAIEAAIALVDLLKADDQVTVIGFNSAPKVGAPLTVDKDAVRAALRRLPESQKSGTRIDLGLATAHEELDGPRHRSENHRSIVLVTDGRQVGPPGNEAVLEVARAIKADRISIVTIGLGEDADEPLLRELASQPDYYFRAPDAEDLLALYREIARFIPCP